MPTMSKFQPLPDFDIKDIFLMLRNAGISSSTVATQCDFSTASAYNYVNKDMEPNLRIGIKIWNYACKRLSDEEIQKVIEMKKQKNGLQ